LTRKRQKDDPLRGMRQAINEGRLRSLLWDDDGGDCPVEVDEQFPLRSCLIVITKTHRIKRNSSRFWRAEFERYVPERRYMLARGAGDGKGYVDDPDLAQREQAPDELAEPYEPSPAERVAGVVGGNDREPPEPEAVPPHEIENYTGSKLARARFDAEVEEARAREREQPLSVRIASIVRRAKAKHVDISGDVFVIRQRLGKGDLSGARARADAAESRLAS